MAKKMENAALVVLSGGQDSTTCLYEAKKHQRQGKFRRLHAITFDYGQRHRLEIDAAAWVGFLSGLLPVELDEKNRYLSVRSRMERYLGIDEEHEDTRIPVPIEAWDTHETLKVGRILTATSPLLDISSNVGQYNSPAEMPGGVEPTFVPMRNMLFAVIAANRAVRLGASSIYLGVCEEDYGGYPDCRSRFINSLLHTIHESLDSDFGKQLRIATPLMSRSKRQTVELAMENGAYPILSRTHTCYRGEFPPCGRCHACIIRARGFDECCVSDPLIVRAIEEGGLPSNYPKTGLVVQ